MQSIVRLEECHDRKSFDCGNTALNDFLVKRGISTLGGVTYVAVADPASVEILGYFTIAPDLAQYGRSGVKRTLVELRYLAVDKRYQKQGIREELLLYVMTDVVKIADRAGIEALVVEPIDQKAKEWFLRRDFGFYETYIPEKRLILVMEAMRDVLGSLS